MSGCTSDFCNFTSNRAPLNELPRKTIAAIARRQAIQISKDLA